MKNLTVEQKAVKMQKELTKKSGKFLKSLEKDKFKTGSDQEHAQEMWSRVQVELALLKKLLTD